MEPRALGSSFLGEELVSPPGRVASNPRTATASQRAAGPAVGAAGAAAFVCFSFPFRAGV